MDQPRKQNWGTTITPKDNAALLHSLRRKNSIMRFSIIIPAHNEEKYIGKTLSSLAEQTHLPTKIIVINDDSSDNTASVVQKFVNQYKFIHLINNTSSQEHLPGSKVIRAFEKGQRLLDEEYDILCKFDADLIFPKDYLEKLKNVFIKNPKIGMAGGFCYIQKQEKWVLESLTNKEHIRGALKSYRKKCFQDIGGLKASMGWDTADELLAKYHGWEVRTITSLKVKHLRPTAKTYNPASKLKQGEAFYKLHYGWTITTIAAVKLSFLKKKASFFIDCMRGFSLAKKKKLPYLVTAEEGKWIRNYRWKKIKQKLF